MALPWTKSKRRAVREREEAAKALRETLELNPSIENLINRCADELETNNFGEAIRVAMRRHST